MSVSVVFPKFTLEKSSGEISNWLVEAGDQVTAEQRPIVIITSNSEKELPDAFLRRCVFHYIAFPERDQLAQIVGVHFPDLEMKLLEATLWRFYWLRSLEELRKKPSTSELLDWIAVLLRGGISEDQLREGLPFVGALIKQERDSEGVSTHLRLGR